MTREDMDRIQMSFRLIESEKGAAGVQLYDKLFELDPSLVPLFKTDMGRQGEKLIESIGFAVRQINNPYGLQDGFYKMGERHRLYGVRDRDFDAMRVAMVWMLERRLGEEFTADVRQSWLNMFDWVAGMMRAAPADGKLLDEAVD